MQENSYSDPSDASEHSRREADDRAFSGQVLVRDKVTGVVYDIDTLDQSFFAAEAGLSDDEKSVAPASIPTGAVAASPPLHSIFHRKDTIQCRDLQLVQQIRHTNTASMQQEPVWVLQLSPSGRYLASGGGTDSSGIVCVWKLLPQSNTQPVEGQAPARLIEEPAFRQYLGHTSHVTDLAWSPRDLLLSASTDHFVRLWHVSCGSCLFKFQHPDCVTSLAFHPTDDRHFLTGCFDKKLRVWNLETGRVILWQATTVMITAVAFSPDAKFAVAGLYNGQCTFYFTDRLRYHTQIEARNRRGRWNKGRKVTGLQFSPDGSRLLVTTNDSNIRLFSMDDYSMVFKYGGTKNTTMQIRATFDKTGEHVVCGSEDNNVYIWRTLHDHYNPGLNKRLTGFRRMKNKSWESVRIPNTTQEGSAVVCAMLHIPHRGRSGLQSAWLIAANSNGVISTVRVIGGAVAV